MKFILPVSGKYRENQCGWVTTFLKLMKYSSLILLLFCTSSIMLLASTTSAQSIKEVKIDLNIKNKTLDKVFEAIEKSSPFKFTYDPAKMRSFGSVSIIESNITVANALKKVLPFPFTFEEKDAYVVIKEKPYQKKAIIELKAAKADITITGTVRDNIDVLPGASILLKGTNIGTVTDLNGKFVIDVPSGNSILIISSVGFTKQEITVGDKKVINVTLVSDNKLEEVVVVAFGTQKKSSMVGSVTSINPSELKVPSSNLTSALAGRAPGVIAYQRSGEPGQDNAEFFIRGVTTFGYKKDPLILIDGIELTTNDLARLQVDDIASFSILKDATATALYGSRAANGIILVSTKEGAVGKAKLAFRFENSMSTATRNIELADPVTYMKLSNEAILTRDQLGGGTQELYSDRKIENTVPGNGTLIYPANDWRELMFKDFTANQRANLSISGGGGVARYFVSGAYNKDNGLMKVDKRNNFNTNIDLKSYTLRSNVNIDVTKGTKLTVRLSGNFDEYSGPIDGGKGMYNKVMSSNPVLFPAYYPVDAEHSETHIMFGNYGEQGNYVNPYADMVKGYKENSKSLMLAQLELSQDLKFITEGLTFSAMANTNRRSYFEVRRNYNPFYYAVNGFDDVTGSYSLLNLNPNTGTEYLGYSNGSTTASSAFYLESRLSYNRTVNKKHQFGGLMVVMMQTRSDANATNLQLSLPYRNLGFSGRATYDFDKRYYAEFTFGYNGSERFDKNNRFGFFPSVGAAWTVSNESFFEGIKPVFTNLRLRATYGIIGNDAIGSAADRFFYLSNVNMNDGGRSAYFGNNEGSMYSQNGISISRYANSRITWETSKQRNLALEIGLFDKVTIDAEYFSQQRENILMTRASIPVEAGFAAPVKANVGAASSNGIEVSTNYKQYFPNGAWITGLANVTYAKSKYTVYEEPIYDEAYRYSVGNSIYQRKGYIAERLFVDDAEAANSPLQSFGEYGGGDIKYLDVNKDGKVSEADMVPIGNPTLPEIVYGFGFSSGFKNFDFSAFFQGLANESFWIDANRTSPFNGGNQLLKAYADSYWSEDRRDVYSLWPRLSANVNANNSQTSTWFMRDGSFLRLKEVEVGYTLPKKFQEKVHTSTFRVYLSATNLVNFSKFGLWDVEMGGDGLGYPIQKVFNVGLNLTF